MERDQANSGRAGGGCLDVEPSLGQYLEGELAEAERGAVESHIAACSPCREMLEAMGQGLALLRQAPEVVVPPRLVARILEQTTGRLSWRERWRAWLRPTLEPRLALGLAMALISFSIVFKAAGVDVSNLTLADLSPGQLYLQLDRSAHLVRTRVEKYYRNLRLVYEIQTQLQAIREATTPPEQPAQQQQRQSPPPARNKWSRQVTYVAAFIL